MVRRGRPTRPQDLLDNGLVSGCDGYADLSRLKSTKRPTALFPEKSHKIAGSEGVLPECSSRLTMSCSCC